ncbi:MAG TPA: VIT domain-containing protein [Verrucomicrobiae bacterium]|jgi:Ca-activated chloride channel family protein
MKKTFIRGSRCLLAVAALVTWLIPTSSRAAGLLVADGGFGGVLEVKDHEVHVTINNGIAVTRVTQVFHNTENRAVEALYTFPVPRGASVANFSMWINGKEMVGEVLEKKRAREIYDSYKQTRRDPGLLEQVDYKTFEMRIFPIGPGADQKVEMTYYQELDFDQDWATYVYPLATTTRKVPDSRAKGKFAFALDMKSAVPIAALESPSHGDAFVVAKHGDSFYQASLEAPGGSLAKDVVLACHLTRPRTGFDLVTSKRDGEDGYFCLTLTAGEDLAKLEDGMDYVFLLDVSGSMANDGKLLVSKDSIGAFIHELGDKDRFEVMTFNVQPNMAFNALRPATAEAKQNAIAYLATQQARGGTVLHPALTTAYKYADADRPLNVVLLSDGLTEQQERRTLLELIQSRPRGARVFCIGVGNDVDRPLLEQLAQDAGGLSAFLSHGDNFARQAQAFRRKLTRPVGTDLQVDFAGVKVSDLEPKSLPNLYHGTPLRIYGRYQGGGEAEVKLRGSVNGTELKKSAKLEFPKQDAANPELDRMWAWHRIDGLLKQADRAGSRAAVIDDIVRLGEGYSIATEYTSFLVLENDAEFQRWKIARNNVLRTDRDRKAQEVVRSQLDAMRNKALADLGPQPDRPLLAVARPSQPPTLAAPQRAPSPQNVAPAIAPAPRSRQSSDFGLGSGPVGPLFLGLLLWVRRLRQKKA